jgi:ribosomal-protein-serine acetyltransferase
MDPLRSSRLPLSDSAYLRLICEADAPELHALIEANRERLAKWLSWAATQTFDDTLGFIRRAEAQIAANDGFHTAIVYEGHLAGVISYMGINWRNRGTTLGYWLDATHQGRGTMTSAVRLLVDHAVFVWELNRVEIRAAVENRLSRAIPERLGFRQEATLRQAELVGGRYLDTALYAMLAADWRLTR